MLNKDIYHIILLKADIRDIINIYIACRPSYKLEYYFDVRVKEYKYSGNHPPEKSGACTCYGACRDKSECTIYYIPLSDNIGNMCTLKSDILYLHHRGNDEPAIIYKNGTKKWYKYGKLHRDNDQPAIIDHNGNMIWMKYGELHRDNDQPAVIMHDGVKKWYRNSVRYR